MRLCTLQDGTRDGRLAVVRGDGRALAPAGSIARSLQQALETWEASEPRLRSLAEELEAGRLAGEPVEAERLAAPLPRAYEWVDGSAFLNHVRLVRKARGAEPPPTLESDPLVYQGGSGVLLEPRDPIPLVDERYGLD